MIRSQKVQDVSVTIDGHAAGMVAATVHPHSEDHATLAEVGDDDPCRYLGCNSAKCAWITGEVVSKVVARKACGNAKALGNQMKNSTGLLKIETLTQCLHAVRGK